MTALQRVPRLVRTAAFVLVGLVGVLAVPACSEGADGAGDATGTVAETTPAPTVGDDPDQVRLTEGQPVVLSAEGGAAQTTVVLTGFHNGADPSVVLEVTDDGDDQHTLSLGEAVEIAGDDWRLSEIAVSDTEGVAGSATLVRGVAEGADPGADEAGADEGQD